MNVSSATVEKALTSTLRLRYTPMSPFARKVLVAAHETGTFSKLDLVIADVWTNPDGIIDDNPLIKVPTLRTPQGIIPNSTLICEYLDQLGGSPILIPEKPEERWPVLSAYAIADGVMEAAVAHVVERMRRPADYQWNGWLDRQISKIENGLDHLSTICPDDPKRADLFTITLACTLEYLDTRIPEHDWRAAHPKLATWLKEFEQRPSMTATRPKR